MCTGMVWKMLGKPGVVIVEQQHTGARHLLTKNYDNLRKEAAVVQSVCFRQTHSTVTRNATHHSSSTCCSGDHACCTLLLEFSVIILISFL